MDRINVLLPNEILWKIFSYCDLHTVLWTLPYVCHQWCAVVRQLPMAGYIDLKIYDHDQYQDYEFPSAYKLARRKCPFSLGGGSKNNSITDGNHDDTKGNLEENEIINKKLKYSIPRTQSFSFCNTKAIPIQNSTTTTTSTTTNNGNVDCQILLNKKSSKLKIKNRCSRSHNRNSSYCSSSTLSRSRSSSCSSHSSTTSTCSNNNLTSNLKNSSKTRLLNNSNYKTGYDNSSITAPTTNIDSTKTTSNNNKSDMDTKEDANILSPSSETDGFTVKKKSILASPNPVIKKNQSSIIGFSTFFSTTSSLLQTLSSHHSSSENKNKSTTSPSASATTSSISSHSIDTNNKNSTTQKSNNKDMNEIIMSTLTTDALSNYKNDNNNNSTNNNSKGKNCSNKNQDNKHYSTTIITAATTTKNIVDKNKKSDSKATSLSYHPCSEELELKSKSVKSFIITCDQFKYDQRSKIPIAFTMYLVIPLSFLLHKDVSNNHYLNYTPVHDYLKVWKASIKQPKINFVVNSIDISIRSTSSGDINPRINTIKELNPSTSFSYPLTLKTNDTKSKSSLSLDENSDIEFITTSSSSYASTSSLPSTTIIASSSLSASKPRLISNLETYKDDNLSKLTTPPKHSVITNHLTNTTITTTLSTKTLNTSSSTSIHPFTPVIKIPVTNTTTTTTTITTNNLTPIIKNNSYYPSNANVLLIKNNNSHTSITMELLDLLLGKQKFLPKVLKVKNVEWTIGLLNLIPKTVNYLEISFVGTPNVDLVKTGVAYLSSFIKNISILSCTIIKPRLRHRPQYYHLPPYYNKKNDVCN